MQVRRDEDARIEICNRDGKKVMILSENVAADMVAQLVTLKVYPKRKKGILKHLADFGCDEEALKEVAAIETLARNVVEELHKDGLPPYSEEDIEEAIRCVVLVWLEERVAELLDDKEET